MRPTHQSWSLLAAAVATAALAACSPKDNARTDTAAPAATISPADSAARHDTMAGMVHDSGPNVSHEGWSDAQIVAYTAAANHEEINEGQLAAKKAVNADVKAFAKMMAADHETMLKEGQAFAKSHNITPDTTKGEVTGMMKDQADEMKKYNEDKAGADWDKHFLDDQIDGHKNVLGKLQDAAKATTNADLQTMLTKAAGKVQEHLTKAQALKDKYPKS